MFGMNLSWLSALLQDPIVSGVITSLIVTLIVGVLKLIPRLIFRMQVSREDVKEHFKDLKTKIVQPWLEKLEELNADANVTSLDQGLFDDLTNEHYPEINSALSEFNQSHEEMRSSEKTLKNEVLEHVERMLGENGLSFQKTYSVTENVVFSNYLRDYVLGVMELGKWYAQIGMDTVPCRDRNVSLYIIKVDGTELYRTTQKSKEEAEKVVRVLDDIARTLAIDPTLNELDKNVKERRRDCWRKRERLINLLKDISMKTTFRIRKKYLIFPRLCKYLKP